MKRTLTTAHSFHWNMYHYLST